MARLASSPVAFSRPPLHFQPPRFSNIVHRSPIIRLNTRRSRFPTVACQTDPNSPEASTSEKPIVPAQVEEIAEQAAPSSSDVILPEFPTKTINKQIAAVSTLAAVALFLSTRLDFGISLKDLSAAALPYEEALSNGKPTVVEFYADWCEVCRELAPDVYKVEQEFKDRVNFVMLNVDNTRWEQELDEFGVEGIPHFSFLDKEGNEEGNVVGRLPRKYLMENVDALARGEASVPHSRIVGQYSSAEARKRARIRNAQELYEASNPRGKPLISR